MSWLRTLPRKTVMTAVARMCIAGSHACDFSVTRLRTAAATVLTLLRLCR